MVVVRWAHVTTMRGTSRYQIDAMTNEKLQLWDRFCTEHKVWETGVELFACDAAGRVASAPFGKDSRLILSRSAEMGALMIREVGHVISQGTNHSEGLLYIMHGGKNPAVSFRCISAAPADAGRAVAISRLICWAWRRIRPSLGAGARATRTTSVTSAQLPAQGIARKRSQRSTADGRSRFFWTRRQ